MSKLIGALLSTLLGYTLKIPRSWSFILISPPPSWYSISTFCLLNLLFLVCLQNSEQDVIDLPTLTAYVSYARKNIHPELSDEAAEELTRGYVEMRRRGNFPGSSKKVLTSNFSRSLFSLFRGINLAGTKPNITLKQNLLPKGLKSL